MGRGVLTDIAGGLGLLTALGMAACSSSDAKSAGPGGDGGSSPTGSGGAVSVADSGTADGGGGIAPGAGGAAPADAGTGEAPDGNPAPDSGAEGDPLVDAIVSDPRVAAALQGAADAGHPLVLHTERQPPAIAGYYLKPPNEGSYVATSNGDGVGNGVLGVELRFSVDPQDVVTEASISFNAGQPFVGGVERGIVLRGAGDELTLYTTYHARCPVAGSDFETDGYSITSARFVADTGYWLFVRRLVVTTKTTGTLTPDCAQIYIADSEVVGGWSESEVPRYQSITVGDLQYMCVDGDAGYVEDETWKRDGGNCTCTADYQVVCF